MKINGNKLMLAAYVVLLFTVPIVSTDVYLPAIPRMMVLFGAPLELLNLTLASFFIPFSASTLIWGTLSDKYGRKPILLTSLTLYVLTSFLCMIATNVYQLIFLRAFQGIGGGSAMTIAPLKATVELPGIMVRPDWTKQVFTFRMCLMTYS